jgi:hypothetical protein
MLLLDIYELIDQMLLHIDWVARSASSNVQQDVLLGPRIVNTFP